MSNNPLFPLCRIGQTVSTVNASSEGPFRANPWRVGLPMRSLCGIVSFESGNKSTKRLQRRKGFCLVAHEGTSRPDCGRISTGRRRYGEHGGSSRSAERADPLSHGALQTTPPRPRFASWAVSIGGSPAASSPLSLQDGRRALPRADCETRPPRPLRAIRASLLRWKSQGVA